VSLHSNGTGTTVKGSCSSDGVCRYTANGTSDNVKGSCSSDGVCRYTANETSDNVKGCCSDGVCRYTANGTSDNVKGCCSDGVLVFRIKTYIVLVLNKLIFLGTDAENNTNTRSISTIFILCVTIQQGRLIDYRETLQPVASLLRDINDQHKTCLNIIVKCYKQEPRQIRNLNNLGSRGYI
jgi:hypothetical protein